MVRVFANGPGDLSSISCRVIPKTQKMVLDASLLNCITRYGSRVKWGNPGKGIAPSITPWCDSYRKGSLRITLDYGRQLNTGSLVKWVECSLMVRETWVQSLVTSYQRLQKWYLIPACLTLNIRYVSRVKWSNSGKGVAPFPFTSM